MSRPVVFLDRDGVLVRDDGLVTRSEQLELMPGVPESLEKLNAAGFQLVVVSNQAVVARGLIDERGVDGINARLADMIAGAGGPRLAAWYFCPHHPKADAPAYRKICACRKPEPGMLLRAIEELDLAVARSFMVGDRITDIEAGAAAGCRTILVETGQHDAARIESGAGPREVIRPDHVCADLPAAARWILEQR